MQTPLPVTLTLALLLLAVLPHTDAGAPESVTLHVQADAKLLSDHEPFAWTVTLEWADVAALNTTGTPNGLDLLAHAAAVHGTTHAVTWHDLDGDGTLETAFVDEVDGVQTDFTLLLVGYFWALYEDGVSSETGINGIDLRPGLALDVVYTGWPVDA